MNHSYETLPEGYTKAFSIDLQKDKKLMLLVNGIALLIAAVMIAVMAVFVPFRDLYTSISEIMEQNPIIYLIGCGVLIVSLVVYIILHEAVHGFTMKLYGAKKIKYGFTGVYAFAGSDTCFAKKPYIVVGLAPVVVFGVIFAVLQLLMPNPFYMWLVYILQIANISGAGGDLYVSIRFSKLPADILVQDSGVGMKVFTRKHEQS